MMDGQDRNKKQENVTSFKRLNLKYVYKIFFVE